jgi:hypothetical protein
MAVEQMNENELRALFAFIESLKEISDLIISQEKNTVSDF